MILKLKLPPSATFQKSTNQNNVSLYWKGGGVFKGLWLKLPI